MVDILMMLFNGTTFTFNRTNGNISINLNPQRIDVPNGAKLLFIILLLPVDM
ncbi:MAG: hypothetical protein CM15mV4_1370 [Caudoviricetes sp.]|nr:MAG: hypothetical protein CM15mV4_1370 [Caudoviricetes sp.]